MQEASIAYLDHAATTPIRPDVLDAMVSVLGHDFGNPSGGHSVARAAKADLEAARESVASDLGASPSEIVFTNSGTEADNLAIFGAARAARAAGHGDAIVVTSIEHKAVLAAARRLATEGFSVSEAPVTPGGIVDLEALGDLLDEQTGLVSLMLVNNEVGTIQPLPEVVELVRARSPRAVIHTDAVQAAAWVDVATLAADAELISVSAHKLGGPKGTGALVVRGLTPLVPLLEGGGQEHGRRAGTSNVAGAVGLAQALRATVDERDVTIARVTDLRDRLRGRLLEIPDSWENGDAAVKVAGNVHVGFGGVESEALLVLADRAGVCAAAGSSCSSGATEPSYVLAAMGLDPADAGASIRLSLGFASADTDVDRALAVLPVAVEQLRAAGGTKIRATA
ncbi:MAG TPA: cysteine desulfurase family protein [Acidimicrobiia bacterium]|nr:cysteine desulfurase family protein [Acidimicrobiia bacterium]